MQNNISRRVILFVPVAAQPLLTGRLLQYRDESISHSIWLGRCHPRRTMHVHCAASGRRVQTNAFIIFITVASRTALYCRYVIIPSLVCLYRQR